MKKIISLILLFVFVVSSAFAVYANDEYENLRALKVIPKEITEENADELITRETFAYMSAKMMSAGVIAPQATNFADVDETNAYSGYINFLVNAGAVSGKGDGNFNPGGNVTFGAACKIIVTLLGYGDLAESLGGFSGGYEQVAQELKLYSGVVCYEGYLTKGGAVKMIDNALSAPMASNELIITQDGLINNVQKDKEKTLINDVFGISVYQAFIDGVNQTRQSIDVTIIKNKYSANKVVLNSGEKVSFTYDDELDVLSYRYAPVTIMVSEDDEVIGISKSEDVKVLVAPISSVNGNSDKNTQPFKPSAIKRLTILDDETEYDISENLRVYHNEAETTSSVYLVGKVARLVIEDDEIVSIETWDLTEGGLITEFTEKELVYTKGEVKGMKLRDIDTFKNKYVYIDGESAAVDMIKTPALFDYYKNENTLVLVISEKFVADTLYSVGSRGFEIGDFVFAKGDNVYYKNAAGEFKKNDSYLSYLNTDIKAYIAPCGDVMYIEPMMGTVSSDNKFFGLVIGSQKDTLDEEKISLKILRFKPEVKEEFYRVTEKTVFCDELTRQDIADNAGVIKGDYVYEFEVRENGNISHIRKASYMEGYNGKAERDITNFVYDGTAMINVNSKPLYFKGVPLTFVYDGDDGITAQHIDWSKIYGNTCKATVSFFVHSGNEMSSLPDLVFVCGDGVKNLCVRDLKYGIVTGKQFALSDDGEECVSVDVYMKSGKTSYKISKETAEKLGQRAFITFQDGAFFNEDEIVMNNILDLSGDSSNWACVSGYATAGMHIGTVEKIDNLRVWTKEDDGTIDVNYYHPSINFFLEIDTQSPNNSVKNISFEDITYGDTVLYNVTADGVKGVILVK